MWTYFFDLGKGIIVVLIVGAITRIMCFTISNNNFVQFFYDILICAFIPNTCFFLIYRRTEEFKRLFNTIRRW